MANTLFVAFVVLTLCTAVVDVVFLLAWIKGVGLLMFPGLHVVIGIPLIVLLSSLLQLVFTILAVVIDHYRSRPSGILMSSL